MRRPSPANDAGAHRVPLNTLREGVMITALLCLAIATVMGASLAQAPASPLARLETALGIWASLLLVAVAVQRVRIDEWFRAGRIGGFVATAFISAFAAWFALSPGLEARFGVIDDHVILSQLGPGRKHLKWNQWPERLRASEAFSFGTKGRYRPAYAALQLAETCSWGKDARLWYGARIILCAATLLFLTRAASPVLGATLAIAGSMAVLGTPAIADTYCRLGPSEAYGIAALAVGIWALTKAARGEGAWCWWLTLAGFGMASMCKENFVPMAILACVVGTFLLLRRKPGHRAQAWIALGLLAAHSLFMLAVIARMLLSMKQDIYSNPVGIGSVVPPLGSAALTLLFGSALTALWPLLGWSLWIARRGRTGVAFPFSKAAAGFVLVALAAWFSQAAFYRNDLWPSGMRYDLPGIIVPVALLVFGAWQLLRMMDSEATGRIVSSALFIGLMLAGGSGAMNHVRAQAVANASVTRHYSAWVDRLAKTALADPGRVIVLVPERPLNHYEMLSSVTVFLRHKKVPNPVVYTTRFLGQPVGIAQEKTLFTTLVQGTNSKDPLLRNDLAADSGALFAAFGAASAAALTAEHANLHPKSLDEVLRPPPR